MARKVDDDDSVYMQNFIQDIIEKYGPRMPGSASEKDAALYIKKEMDKTCDEAYLEKFEFQPRAFLGWILLDVILILVSMILFFISGVSSNQALQIVLQSIGTLLVALSIIILWIEFFNCEEFIDRFWKTKNSQNVVGRILPVGDPKKLIIFSGHVDSALQFNIIRYGKYAYPFVQFWGLISILLWFGVEIAGIIFASLNNFQNIENFGFIIVVISLPAMIFLSLFVSPGELANKVPGAVDNLSAVALVLALGRHLKKHPEIIPSDTEIRLIAFGAEEAGMRGASRYAEKHLEELKTLKTRVINMECIQNLDYLSLLDQEPTTRTKHSNELKKEIMSAANKAKVLISSSGNSPLERIFGIFAGGTDATAFTKRAIDATTILGINFMDYLNFYHQPFDTPDQIVPGSLEQVLRILTTFLEIQSSHLQDIFGDIQEIDRKEEKKEKLEQILEQ